ncbi:fam-b protein [Plasmodium berghei]|uniref:Fam-b protein n=2 Tax=Plasmodium berghei TaxID=5821 RepID=A0A077X5U1_PLABA|nr:fam-b protein [Plasmodium berghei ANKA]SCL82276.1 fam-b protein [Plasmodium berghei]SCL82396.1 fam-b protein [Plasmodium berghei]SCL86194.1 fam-b protein [Plasmodium berghei]VUC54206.1 fam-b protein [Plasmodium berghei ANKA]|eukprot:XP_034420047.1 fam-b protein [Plasmodium berghei ANKA]
MRISILKYVLFSIVICSFEYAKNELYFVNDRGIYLERNVMHFRNNRILADVDNKTKDIIYGYRKKKNEVQKESDNKRNGELGIQPKQDKIIANKDENNSASEQESFNQLENKGYLSGTKYNETDSSNNHKKLQADQELRLWEIKVFKKSLLLIIRVLAILVSKTIKILLLLLRIVFFIFKVWWESRNNRFKLK